jgi:hypothetical protein
MTDQNLGVSLSDVKVTTKSPPTNKESGDDIAAYRHDMRRSLLIGGLAIVIELGVYFSGILR